MSMIDTFQALLQKGPDNALLRYSLANAYYSDNQYQAAIEHLAQAVIQDAGYSAAWKMLGRCHFEVGNYQEALEVYQSGIETAAGKGDVQAEKEMTVFLKRTQKKLDQSA